MADIAREVAQGDQKGEHQVLAYLRDTLKYGLGDRERAGLERFFLMAVELGLAQDPRPLKFFS